MFDPETFLGSVWAAVVGVAVAAIAAWLLGRLASYVNDRTVIEGRVVIIHDDKEVEVVVNAGYGVETQTLLRLSEQAGCVSILVGLNPATTNINVTRVDIRPLERRWGLAPHVGLRWRAVPTLTRGWPRYWHQWRGNDTAPVQIPRFRGLVFRHAGRVDYCTVGQSSNNRGGAVAAIEERIIDSTKVGHPMPRQIPSSLRRRAGEPLWLWIEIMVGRPWSGWLSVNVTADRREYFTRLRCQVVNDSRRFND